jgi:transposase-like protein
MTKKTSNRFSSEVRQRAVRMVLEHGGDHASQRSAISSIAATIGCTAETLRKWVREYATLDWVDWYNNRRLLEPIGNMPPVEAETRYYAQLEAPALAA